MFKKVCVISFCLVVFMPVGALAGQPERRRDSPADPAVGVVVPLTGGAAEYGVAFRNGIEMARRDGVAGVDDLHWIFEDSKYDTKLAVAGFRKVASMDGALLTYVFGGPMSEALAPLAESERRALIVSINEPKVAVGKRFVIRFSNPAHDYGAVLAGWFVKRGIRRVAVVKAENQYLNCMLDGLTRSLPSGISLDVVDSFQTEESDFKSTISKLRRQKSFDAVGVYLLPGQVSLFFRQLRQQNVAIPAFGTDFFESTSEIIQAAGAMHGAVFPNNTVSEEFRREYRREHGNDSQITWAGYGYELAALLGKALSAKKPVPAAEILMADLRSVPVRQGVMGPVSFEASADGDSFFRFPVVLKRVSGEKVVETDD